jgi:hypothetical protein
MKRFISIEGTTNVLEIEIVTALNGVTPLLYLEELENRKWRLTYSKDVFNDLTMIKGFAFRAAPETLLGKNTFPGFIDVVQLGTDEVMKSIEIERAIPIPNQGGLRFITLERNKQNPQNPNDPRNKKWIMRYFTNLMPDIVNIPGLKIIRED